jgi:hypothetical protein
MWHTIINYLYLHRTAVMQLAGGAAGISVLLEALLLKLKNRWHVDSKKLAYTLLHAFSGLTAVLAPFLSSIPDKDAPAIYASLAILAQTWHRFVVSPAYTKWIIPFLNYQENEVVKNVKGQTSSDAQKASLDPAGSVEPDQFLGQ